MKNNSLPNCFILLITLVLFIGLGIGCLTDSESNPAVIDDDVGTEDSHGLDDVEPVEDTDVIEEFRKPTTSDSPQLTDVMTCPPPCEDDSVFGTYRLGSRPHMMATGAILESWLYPHEYFVVDGSLLEMNYWWLPADYYAVVVHEGEFLPMRYLPVAGDEFPSMDEIESWTEDEYGYVEVISRENNAVLNYTVVIPPWAFPEEAAYNIQIITFPIWEPREDALILAMKAVKAGPSTREFHYNHTIYYGSTEYGEPSIRDRQDEAKTWESPVAGGFVGPVNLMFLAPPTDIYNWEAFDHLYDGARLGEVMEVSEPTVELKFYTAGARKQIFHTDTQGTNMYYLFRDDEIIDVFLLDPGEGDYNSLVNFEEKGLVLPIEVELTEEPAAFQIMVVPWPFQPQHADEDLHLPIGNHPVASNALLLKYSPE